VDQVAHGHVPFREGQADDDAVGLDALRAGAQRGAEGRPHDRLFHRLDSLFFGRHDLVLRSEVDPRVAAFGRIEKIHFASCEGVHSGRSDVPLLPALSLDGRGPLHRQVYRSIRAGILDRRILPAAQLPSSRELAVQAGLSRNTVIRAYEQLASEGYTETRHGAGTFVVPALPAPPTEPPRRRRVPTLPLSEYAARAVEAVGPWGTSFDIPRRGLEFDFRYGEPSYVDFPHETWARINGARLRRASVRRLSYGDPGGAPELREALADYLGRARGVSCTPEHVLVVRGSQQAIDLAIRVLLDPGERVVLEEPHYPGFRWALSAAGADIATVPVDEHGLSATGLDAVPSARLAVVTPSHQYPTGVVMPVARRTQLLQWAERAGAWILEDDYDGEYRYDGAPIESLQGIDGGRRVLYAGTMSKVMFPSLRIGYLVLPAELVHPFAAVQALADTGTAGIEQLALAQFIREGHFERHLRRSRLRHAARRAALLDAVHEHLGDAVTVSGENAGLHLLLWLEGFTQQAARDLRRAAAKRDVGVYPADPCFTSRPRRPALLLGYSGLDESRIREGIRRLGEVVRGL
jgi:GntR family transcriptional regulator/MocR family aminotransferase